MTNTELDLLIVSAIAVVALALLIWAMHNTSKGERK